MGITGIDCDFGVHHNHPTLHVISSLTQSIRHSLLDYPRPSASGTRPGCVNRKLRNFQGICRHGSAALRSPRFARPAEINLISGRRTQNTPGTTPKKKSQRSQKHDGSRRPTRCPHVRRKIELCNDAAVRQHDHQHNHEGKGDNTVATADR
jgi:hypothetical protein